GETYNHLLPRASPLDSLAYQAYGEARDLDSTFAPVLFHLIEFAVRRGDLPRAASLLDEYHRRDADPELVGLVELALHCVRGGMPPAAWRDAAVRTPARVFGAAQWLALGGLRQPACARAALESLLSDDTTAAVAREPYRFGALLALHAILVAQNRTDEVRAMLERDTVFNPSYRGQLYVLGALAGAGFEREADGFVERGLRAYRADPGAVSNLDLWFLASWTGARGQGPEAAEMGGRVLQRAGGIDGRRDSLLAASILARATLARGDTAAALEQLRRLSPNATSNQDLTWNPWESLGGERLLLARLLLARGRPAEARDVAANFDSPVPITYLMYLPASLSLRVQAAEQLGDTRLARIAAERLAALRGRARQ
ncbi:MAG: tetratricopeptide repeat protein, partial [Gemmatimonadales bacterium]